MQWLGVVSKTKVTGSLKLHLGSRKKEILELCQGVAGKGPQLRQGEVGYLAVASGPC